MRISTAYQFDTYSRSVAQSAARYFDSQKAVLTGKKLNDLHDDPFGAARVLSMRSLKSANEQYQKNLTTAKSTLVMTESTLADVSTALREANTIALKGANGTSDQTARNAMAQQIKDIQSRILDLANAQGPNGQYLFAGQETKTKPFSISADTGSGPPSGGTQLAGGDYLVFQGDELPVTVETGPMDVLVANTNGRPFLTQAYQALDQIRMDLQYGNLTQLGDADLQELQKAMDNTGLARAQVGSKLQAVELNQTQLVRRNDELVVGISDVEEVDITEAIQRYKLAETAYQAALTVANQGFKLSLMDFLQ